MMIESAIEVYHYLQQSDSSQANYFLMVDAAQAPEYIYKMSRSHYLSEYYSLFINTPEMNIPFQYSPLLIPITNPVLLPLLHNPIEYEDKSIFSIIKTTMTVFELVIHFQKILEGRLPSGEHVLFRFYDPSIACLLPKMLDSLVYKTLTNPIQSFWFERDDHQFELLHHDILGVSND